MRDTLRVGKHAVGRSGELALVDETRALDYQTLDEWAGSFAVHLQRVGLIAGTRLALLAPNSVSTFALLLACERVGASLLPLNWRLSERELGDVVARARPHAIVTVAPYEDLHFDLPVHLVLGEDGLRVSRTGSSHAPLSDPEIAMILFTSGTTGAPKGAMLSWRQLEVNATNTTKACGLGVGSKVWSALPLFHTGGLNCLATPVLHAGGTAVISARFNAVEALEIMERDRITHVMAVPTMYQNLVDAGLGARPLPALEAAICGGAPCPLPLIDRLHVAGIPFRQGYGLTEAGPNLFSLSPVVGPGRLGSVGRPALEGSIELAEDGEILVSGEHVMRGYLFDDAATAATIDANGTLHTGDIAERDSNGVYWIVGRKKEMFISGGENVFEAEVEKALMDHPAVRLAAVVGVADERWGQVGVGFVELEPNRSASADDVRDWLRERIARYKVPKRLWLEPALPRTDSGKVSKVALRTRASLDAAAKNSERMLVAAQHARVEEQNSSD